MGDVGRLRNLHTHATSLVGELRNTALEETASTFPRIFELVRLVKRLLDAANGLHSSAASPEAQAQYAAWVQRSTWLCDDVAALAQERVYSSDQKQFFRNLLSLLFAGAATCDQVLQQRVEMEGELKQREQQVVALEQKLQAIEATQAEHVLVPRAVLEEALSARSKATVVEQELERRTQMMEELKCKMVSAVEEAERLRTQVQELRSENTTLQELADNRLEVLRTLMERAEATQSSLSDNHALATQVATLQESLDSNVRVVDKLINLNTELMERHNAIALRLAAHHPHPRQEGVSHSPSHNLSAPHAQHGNQNTHTASSNSLSQPPVLAGPSLGTKTGDQGSAGVGGGQGLGGQWPYSGAGQDRALDESKQIRSVGGRDVRGGPPLPAGTGGANGKSKEMEQQVGDRGQTPSFADALASFLGGDKG